MDLLRVKKTATIAAVVYIILVFGLALIDNNSGDFLNAEYKILVSKAFRFMILSGIVLAVPYLMLLAKKNN